MNQTSYRPTIDSPAALEAAWRHLMRPLGFSAPALWLMFIDRDGRPVHQLLEIGELDRAPQGEELTGFVGFLRDVARGIMPGELRVAFLVARPGIVRTQPEDLAWARALYDGCRRADLACEVVHVANDWDLWPLSMDSLDLPTPA